MIKESIETQEDALEKEHRDDEYFERKEKALKVYREIVKNHTPLKRDFWTYPHHPQDPEQEKWALMWK